MEYFQHDYNVRSDDKIKSLIRKHGMIGYGVFWSIVEDLYNNLNAIKLDCEGIAYDLRVEEDLVKSIIHDFGLFQINGDYFGSTGVEKRLYERDIRSKRASENANKRWEKKQKDCKNDATALQDECNGIALKEKKVKESKRKESKVKEIKVKEKKEKIVVYPPLEEFKKYFEENGFDLRVAERAWKGYDAANWHDTTGKKILNWKQKCQNVWFKPENETKNSGPPKINPQHDFSNKIVGDGQTEKTRLMAIEFKKNNPDKVYNPQKTAS